MAPHFKYTNCLKNIFLNRGMAYFNGKFEEISLEKYKGKWLVLFFYPMNFTFVCPTEIIQFCDRADEFRKNNCEIVGCSIDS